MNKFCSAVETEPKFQQLHSESFANNSNTTVAEVRTDLKANRLWDSRFNQVFLEAKTFHIPLRRLLKDEYNYHETMKISSYQQRFLNSRRVVSAPLFFSSPVALPPTITRTTQRLVEKLIEKRKESCPESIIYIGNEISFALLRTSLLYYRVL